MANEAIPTTMSDGRAAVIVPVKHRLDSGTVKWLIAALAVSGVGIATGIFLKKQGAATSQAKTLEKTAKLQKDIDNAAIQGAHTDAAVTDRLQHGTF
jgi:outer membrane murein-binding lipoprotein Lpp